MCSGQPHPREGYFNGSSYVNIISPLMLNKHIGLSFRTCKGGLLFSQRPSLYSSITLDVKPEGLVFTVNIRNHKYESRISANLLDNEWHTVNILYRMGNLTISTSGHMQVIANSTYNSEILSDPDLTTGNDVLVVGKGFVGCILEGPSIVFNASQMQHQHVDWGPCPLPNKACEVVDHCANEPCMWHGRCIRLPDRYYCQCTPRYSGSNCQIDNGSPCDRVPCKNNGKCYEDNTGDYTCICPQGFAGRRCERETKTHLCDNNFPCENNGTCHITGGGNTYKCICQPGFEGNDCEIDVDECLSSPCQHGGTCTDGINRFTCSCGRTGYTGQMCEININECENNPCLNNGICFDNYGGYTCQCAPGFGGQNCELKLSECASNPCSIYPNAVCIESSLPYQCVCMTGFKGIPPNCTRNDICMNDNPCANGSTCQTTINGYGTCICPPGFTGPFCENNIDDCLSLPCQNGGTCYDGTSGYHCNCTSDFMGQNCELPYNACALLPCQNNGTCIPKPDGKSYYCECADTGFEGIHCENNINNCMNENCPEGKICIDGINTFKCVCANGLSGPDCTTPLEVDHCTPTFCKNGGTCIEGARNLTCTCPPGYKGLYCETDINECEIPQICNNGICVNSEGSYQCFCTPGFSGDHCEVDFDECLSHPCFNGASCINKINGFSCNCTPGFTGKDCSININECESNPCKSGARCVDEVATFTCICPEGLTGRLCENNIDDCESSPCQNNGICIDGLNSYTCNCSETGYEGTHCEINIDECVSNPCVNGAQCRDLVKGYMCECFPGYTGVNCEVDINECESNPCQYGGTCKERSVLGYYLPEIRNERSLAHSVFSHEFNYSSAAGYECICPPGILGDNCEINVNECESSPCQYGTCSDLVDGYTCDCEEGFEGTLCEIEINECERYTPCVHGVCHDGRANYMCECNPKYGGKNCSVELTGCNKNECLNGGKCKPYLENETIHKFNCTCPYGFQGPICEKETTMFYDGKSYGIVSTSREEGYDIQLRFKTTLPDGLLAIGKGSTFYILELVNGRLNLHSSLLNKWEGVFIGSGLNDSNWQKVFVAINSSHLVLAANDEQTIYPINLNEGANASHTSFGTTYLGGAMAYLRALPHGPSTFRGCVQDVMINGQWVLLPGAANSSSVSFHGVQLGCKREPQCSPNPCFSGGHCTDLWNNFSCSCERPFLGHTCQYNYTAATFAHENISDSVVTVAVEPAARRAVRTIMDISMFIRTREPYGGIFYLGSKPETVPKSEETIIAARITGGELQVSIQFNGSLESYTVAGVRIDTGYNQLIQVIRNVTLIQIKINGTEYFRKTITVTGQLDLQILQLGSTAPLSQERNFKGIIQDVQMSNGSRIMVVEFFPLDVKDLAPPLSLGSVNFDKDLVLQGIISDDNCRSEPCMHGGTCTVTWNDFSCACTVGYKGKQCQEMEFCQVQDCPTGSECRNLNYGYECVANITLHDPVKQMSPGLKYRLVPGEDSNSLSDIMVTYRSRTGGNLFFIGPDQQGRFLSISVFNDEVRLNWNMGFGNDHRKIVKETRDGSWTIITLKIQENMVTAGLSGGSEDSVTVTANFSQEAWLSLLSTSNISIGGSGDSLAFDKHIYSTTAEDQTNTLDNVHPEAEFSDGSYYKGCIGEVRIGGLLLSYFTAEELNTTNTSGRYHFEMYSGSDLGQDFGCILCFDEKCQNSGKCANATESYTCECVAGFAGDDCSENIDECLENDCKNNSTCIDGLATYTCQCLPGWGGSLCDVDIDECQSNPCLNNGSCIDRLAQFLCICPPEFVGETCDQIKQVTCESEPCYNNAECKDAFNSVTKENFTCICQEGFLGPYCNSAFCEVTPCQNDGSCISNSMKPVCDCALGFTGRLCEINIDDCASNPCSHKGKCIDGINKFRCDCMGTGYTGTTCTIDIDECSTKMADCGSFGECKNTEGSFLCVCNPSKCGVGCNITNPCYNMNPCINEGRCSPVCVDKPDYECICPDNFGGKNCSELRVPEFAGTKVTDIALVVVPILGILVIAGLVSLFVFVMMARKKRATRGTYSPSSQEFSNPRLELDNVMKPPPEERLI
nr:protein crumbs [Halyomorpha halys]